MAIESNGAAPYAPAQAVIDVIEAYRHRSLPTPFTVEVISRIGVSESIAPRTLQALRLLDLVDADGEPTREFQELRKAPDGEFPGRFAEMLRAAYAEVFAYRDPATDDVNKIRDAFRGFSPIGMQERMVRMFLGLCVYAGIIEGKPAAVSANGGRKNAPRRERRVRPTQDQTKPPAPPAPLQHAAQPAFVSMLLDALPSPGSVWPRDLRQKWTAAALAAFELNYQDGDDRG